MIEVARWGSSVAAMTLVTRRMMARLVHISYQLFQPNTSDSIITGPRACEMPARGLALKTERHPMGHGNGTPEPTAEFPASGVFISSVAGHLDARRRRRLSSMRSPAFRFRLPPRHACGALSMRTRAMFCIGVVDDHRSVRAPASLRRCFTRLRQGDTLSARIVLPEPMAAGRGDDRDRLGSSPTASTLR
jgi:hypothetical protein